MTKKPKIDTIAIKLNSRSMKIEPNIDEFSIRRSVLVIKYKQPFIDWINNLDYKYKTTEYLKDTNVYLLPEFSCRKELEKWLRKYYDTIFRDQIDRWQDEGYLWIKQKRTFKMFEQWIDYSLHTMVYDTVEKSRFKR